MHLVRRIINLCRGIHRDGERLRRSGAALTTIGECRGDGDGGSYRYVTTVGGGKGRQVSAAAGAKAYGSVAVGPGIGGCTDVAGGGEDKCRNRSIVAVYLVSRLIDLS